MRDKSGKAIRGSVEHTKIWARYFIRYNNLIFAVLFRTWKILLIENYNIHILNQPGHPGHVRYLSCPSGSSIQTCSILHTDMQLLHRYSWDIDRLSYLSYLDTKYDRYDRHDSYYAIKFPSDWTASPTSTSLFKFTLSAIYSLLPFWSARGATWAECEVRLAVWGPCKRSLDLWIYTAVD